MVPYEAYLFIRQNLIRSVFSIRFGSLRLIVHIFFQITVLPGAHMPQYH